MKRVHCRYLFGLLLLGMIIFIGNFPAEASSIASNDLQINSLVAEREKVENYISTLDSKLQASNDSSQIQEISWLREQALIKLDVIDQKIDRLNKIDVDIKDDPIQSFYEPKPQELKFNLPEQTLNIDFGTYAGLSGWRVSYQHKIDLRTSFKLGAGFADGTDANNVMRKNTVVYFDGIYSLDLLMETWGFSPPFHVYEGLGLNCVLSTSDGTNSQAGTLGGQIFIGSEAPVFGVGDVYAEIGYGIIRTIVVPSFKGANFNLGYRFTF